MLTETFNQQHLLSSLQQTLKANFNDIIVQQPLNRGSFGMVFLVKTSNGKSQYALKAIFKKNNLQSHNKKIDNQIKIHQSLRSKFVVRLYKKFQDEKYKYLLLDYCPNGDLSNLLKQYPGGLPIKILKQVGLEIAKGISTLHSKKIFHGDIKLQNILYSQQTSNNERQYQIKICDFGTASYFEQNQTFEGTIGTPGYMAPEITAIYNQKIDVWSYGCLLYVLATSKYMFPVNKRINISQDIVKRLVFNYKIRGQLLDLLRRIFVYDYSQRISMKQIIKHPFFTGQAQVEAITKRKLSNEISQKSQYQMQRISSIREGSNQSRKSSPKSISSIQIRTDNKQKNSIANSRLKQSYCLYQTNKPSTFREESIKNLKNKIYQLNQNPIVSYGNVKKQKQQLVFKQKEKHDQRESIRNSKYSIQKQIKRLDQEKYRDKQNDMNLNNVNTKTRYPSSETAYLKDISKRKNMNSQANLKNQIKEKSNKMIDSKLGKIVSTKSHQLAHEHHKNQTRPTVPNRSRPSSYASTTNTACKTIDVIRKGDKRLTLGRDEGKTLTLDRKTGVLSPINMQKMPETDYFESNKGRIKITSQGFFKKPISQNQQVNSSVSSRNGMCIHITADGKKITFSQGKNSVTYALEKLPQKYKPQYEYWKNVINIIKNRTQISKLEFIGGNQLRIMVSGRIVGKINNQKVQFKNENDLLSKISSGKAIYDDYNRVSENELKKFGKIYKAMKRILQDKGQM